MKLKNVILCKLNYIKGNFFFHHDMHFLYLPQNIDMFRFEKDQINYVLLYLQTTCVKDLNFVALCH